MSKLLEEFRGWLNDFDENINPNRNQLTMHNIYDTRIDKIKIPQEHYICGLIAQEVYKDPKDRSEFICFVHNSFVFLISSLSSSLIVFSESLKSMVFNSPSLLTYCFLNCLPSSVINVFLYYSEIFI